MKHPREDVSFDDDDTTPVETVPRPPRGCRWRRHVITPGDKFEGEIWCKAEITDPPEWAAKRLR